MPHTSHAFSTGTDWRLLGCAYVKFLITRDVASQRLLETQSFDLSVSVGRLAYVTAEEVYFPAVFGVDTMRPYREVDRLRRRDSAFGAAWARRTRYRRQGMGLALRPVHRSRAAATDVARMLCASWAHQHRTPGQSGLVCDIAPAMLSDLCTRLCQMGEPPTVP
ncbi:hypothetical protein AB0M10_15315 [Streptomyces sp. NPDC051840]|uniref:hypothetical protein n=1 Tax=Streptomyces sp. NPDC051840 TaxID=3154752 RepID=UPI0034144182